MLTLLNYKDEVLPISIRESEITDVDVKMTKLSEIAIKSRLDSLNFRPNQFYVSPMFQAGMFMGAGVSLGTYISNVNVELSFLYGLGSADAFYKNNDQTQTSMLLDGAFMKFFAYGKLGYGISWGSNIRLTPQAGVGVLAFSHSDLPKSSAIVATVSARLDYALNHYIGLFFSPEASFAVSQSIGFKAVSDVSSKVKGWATGFNGKVGISFLF